MTWVRPSRRRTFVPIRLSLEAVEGRTVPAVVVNGTAGADVITADYAYDAAAATYRGTVTVNGKAAYSFLGDVSNDSIYLPDELQVNGLGGNDTISLTKLRDPASQTQHVTIRGGAGNDTITGTAGHDAIYGDAGADSLNGYADEDTLYADDADTGLVGGGGNDTLAFANFGGTLRATPDFISMNGNKLTAASGKFGGIAAFDVTGSNAADTVDLDRFPTFFTKVNGLGGNDTIRVNTAAGLLDGGNGDDTIVNVSTREDYLTVLGGNGNDAISVKAGLATIDGGAGDDDIDGRGVVANDLNAGISVTGGDGADTVRGSDLIDTLDGGAGNDTITGGKGDDTLVGGPGRDSLTGGGDNDTFTVDAADVQWVGGKGYDAVYVTDGVQTAAVTNTTVTVNGRSITATGLEFLSLVGTAKNDTLDASQFDGSVSLDGLDGNDTLRGGKGVAYLSGGAGADKLFGGPAADSLGGGDGADQLTAGAGDDTVEADNADTLVTAGAGTDFVTVAVTGQTIVATDAKVTANGVTVVRPADAETVTYTFFGTPGNDTLDATGYSSAVYYSGDAGDDVIRTGPGDDYVSPGDGNDTVFTNAGNDVVEDYLGNNTVDLGPGSDYAVTGDGNDRVTGGADDDTIGVNGGNDTVDAGDGNDTVQGGDGDNTLDGGPGNDDLSVLIGGTNRLTGGDGNDVLTDLNGGSNPDTFDGGPGDDVITATFLAKSIDAGGGNDRVYVLGIFSQNLVITDTGWTHTANYLPAPQVTPLAGVEYLSVFTDGFDNAVDASAFSGFLFLEDGGGSNTVRVGSGGSFVHLAGSEPFDANTTSTVYGGAGADTLTGGFGNDTLYGRGGADVLAGGAGTDTLHGDDGADTFVVDPDPARAAAEANLWDYNPGEGDQLA